VGQWIELQAADGHRLRAWLAQPSGAPRGGLVVGQEIFGVNRHIRAVTEGWALEGYRAIAPALFDRVERGVELGYTPADFTRGRALKGGCPDASALLDLAAAVAHVAAAGRVGMVGYCWGGSLAWQAACRLDALAAAVPYYGASIPQQPADQHARCVVQAHFGEHDEHIALPGVRAWAAAHPEVEVHLYDAGHGFNCDQRASFDARAAGLARERARAFLTRHLG